MLIADRPDAGEQYLTAMNTSDLTVEADRRGAADVLIAAGFAGQSNVLGQALSRLQAEWDKSAKPRKATEAEIEAAAAASPKHGKPDIHKARTVALVGYATAMRKRAEQMPGRPEVLRLLGEWAQAKGVDPDILSPALFFFLAPTCPVCDGLGHRKLPDAPVLGKTCNHCNGTGKWPRTMEAERVDSFIRGCVARAKHSRKEFLRNR